MRVGSGRAGGNFVICAFTHACHTVVIPGCLSALLPAEFDYDPLELCISLRCQQFVKWETYLLVVVVMSDIAFSKVKQQQLTISTYYVGASDSRSSQLPLGLGRVRGRLGLI